MGQYEMGLYEMDQFEMGQYEMDQFEIGQFEGFSSSSPLSLMNPTFKQIHIDDYSLWMFIRILKYALVV